MNRVITLALKDLLLLLRNKIGLFWIFVFPLMLALFFGTLFNNPQGGNRALSVAVIDEDGSDGSRSFVGRLEKSEALRVMTDRSRAAAEDEVRRGKLTAFVVVPAGFGKAGAIFNPETPGLRVGIDPSRRAEAGYLQGLLTEAVFAGMQDQFLKPEKTREQLRQSVGEIDKAGDLDDNQRKVLKHFLGELDGFLGKVDFGQLNAAGGTPFQGPKITSVDVARETSGPRSAWEITFPSSILWAILGCVQSFVISIVTERVGGTFLRLRLSPLTWTHILAGKGLACFLSCVGVSLVLLAIGIGLGVRPGNWLLLGLALGCTAACFVGLMMLFCTMGKTVEGVSGAAWGILMPLAMIGGGAIPLAFMPSWLLVASHVSPVKWGILALEGAIWRDFTLAEMLTPCGILVGVGAVSFVLGVRVLSRADG